MDDRLDARTLARLARIDPELLSPVQHRSAAAQRHLTEIRARAALVSSRTALVNAARGLAKSYGERLRKCHTQQVGREMTGELSMELRQALEPLLREVESLNERIQEYDRRIAKMTRENRRLVVEKLYTGCGWEGDSTRQIGLKNSGKGFWNCLTDSWEFRSSKLNLFVLHSVIKISRSASAVVLKGSTHSACYLKVCVK